MKVLIIFNHPAPYKVRAFNELSRYVTLDVIFERTKARDRSDAFYNINQYNFHAIFNHKGYFGNEGTYSSEAVNYLKKHAGEYDHIIMNGYSHISEMKCIRYLHRKKIPFILMINGGIKKKEAFFKEKMKRYFISKASAYLSPCQTANEYLTYYGAKEENIYLYPYSTYMDEDVLSEPLSKEEKMKIRSEYHLPEGELFVSAGQFIPRKNNMLLLKLFKETGKQLLLVGEGNEKEKYEAYIRENKADNIRLHPFLKKDQLFDLLKSCDTFITLSQFDIYGQTSLEAFARGLPLISSDCVVSSKEYIQEGKNGFLVSLDNEDEIRKAILDAHLLSSSEALLTAKSITINQEGKSLYETLKRLAK